MCFCHFCRFREHSSHIPSQSSAKHRLLRFLRNDSLQTCFHDTYLSLLILAVLAFDPHPDSRSVWMNFHILRHTAERSRWEQYVCSRIWNSVLPLEQCLHALILMFPGLQNEPKSPHRISVRAKWQNVQGTPTVWSVPHLLRNIVYIIIIITVITSNALAKQPICPSS